MQSTILETIFKRKGLLWSSKKNFASFPYLAPFSYLKFKRISRVYVKLKNQCRGKWIIRPCHLPKFVGILTQYSSISSVCLQKLFIAYGGFLSVKPHPCLMKINIFFFVFVFLTAQWGIFGVLLLFFFYCINLCSNLQYVQEVVTHFI